MELIGAPFALRVGAQATLQAVVHCTAGTEAGVLWFSTNPSVAIVSDGVVEGVAEGAATIVVRSRLTPSVRSSATIRVVAPPPLDPPGPDPIVVRCGDVLTVPEKVVDGDRVTWRACGMALSATPLAADGTPLGVGASGDVAVPSDGSLRLAATGLAAAEPVSLWWFSPEPALIGAGPASLGGTFDRAVVPPAPVPQGEGARAAMRVTPSGGRSAVLAFRTVNQGGVPTDLLLALRVVDGSLVPSVLGIDVAPAGPLDLVVGSGATLTAHVRVCACAPTDVAWSSSDPTSVYVDPDGHVTGVSIGTAIVAARSVFDPDVAAFVAIFVHANPPTPAVLGVRIDGPAEHRIAVGSALQLTARVETVGGAPDGVVWSSTDERVARVDATGRVVAVAGGRTVVWARSIFDTSQGASVTVDVPAVLSISIEGDDVRLLAVGDDVALRAVVGAVGGASDLVVWASSHPRFATVTQVGRVDALAPGKAFVSATSVADPTFTAWVKVIVLPPDPQEPVPAVLSVTIDGPRDLVLAVGEVMRLTATVTAVGGADPSLAWSSNAPDVAIVDDDGAVIGVAGGACAISATSRFDPTRTDAVTIRVPAVSSVMIDGSSTRTWAIGATETFTATVVALGDAPTTVAWSTSDEMVVAIDANGTARAVALGRATVTATSTFDPGRRASVDVTVTVALYPSQFGTSGSDRAAAVAVDAAGQSVVVGSTTGDLFAPNAGHEDVFVRKIGPTGVVLWEAQFGTDRFDRATAVALDASGRVIVVGTTGGAFAGGHAGKDDAFVRVLNPSGVMAWETQFGSSKDDGALGVAVDAAGRVIVVGSTTGSLFGANAGHDDAFVVAFATDGTPLWARQFGGAGVDVASGVAVGADGRAIVVGVTAGALAGPGQGGDDAFVRAVDADGQMLWETQFGTAADDAAVAVAVDSPGRAIVVGTTSGAMAGAHLGREDAFVRIFDPTGALTSETQVGSSGADSAAAVAVAGARIVLVGTTDGAITGTNLGHDDVFAVAFDADALAWAARFGTHQRDVAAGVGIDPEGRVIVVGSTTDDLSAANAGREDVFVHGIAPDGTMP